MSWCAGDLIQSRMTNNVWLVGTRSDHVWSECKCVHGPNVGKTSAVGDKARMYLLARDVTEPIDEAWLEALIALKGIGS